MVDLTLGDRVLDYGVNALHTDCDKIHVCSAAATDYASVLTNSRGNKSFGAGSAFGVPSAGSPAGRKVTSPAITDGVVTSSGVVSRWAAVDSVNSRLLAEGNLTGGVAVTTGQTFTLGAIAVRIPGTAAVAGFATFDPINSTAGALSNGNMTGTQIDAGTSVAVQHQYHSGKKYLEATYANMAGISNVSLFRVVGVVYPTSWVTAQHNSNWAVNGTDTGIPSVLATGSDTVAIAVDFDNTKIWIKSTTNTNWNQNPSADPATNVGGADFSAAMSGVADFILSWYLQDAIGSTSVTLNAGSSAYTFTPPAGFSNW